MLAALLAAEAICVVGAVEEPQVAVPPCRLELAIQPVDRGPSSLHDCRVIVKRHAEARSRGLGRPGGLLHRLRMLLADRDQDLLSRAPMAHPPSGRKRSRTSEIAADPELANACDEDRADAERDEVVAYGSRRNLDHEPPLS